MVFPKLWTKIWTICCLVCIRILYSKIFNNIHEKWFIQVDSFPNPISSGKLHLYKFSFRTWQVNVKHEFSMWPPLFAMHLWALLLMSIIATLIIAGSRFATTHRRLASRAARFSTQITSREHFTVFWTDLHPYGPSWGLIEHLGCQSLKGRFLETPCRSEW